MWLGITEAEALDLMSTFLLTTWELWGKLPTSQGTTLSLAITSEVTF